MAVPQTGPKITPLAMATNSAGKGRKEWRIIIPIEAKIPQYPQDFINSMISAAERRGHQAHQGDPCLRLQNRQAKDRQTRIKTEAAMKNVFRYFIYGIKT
jgi:hypothetical protein